MVTIEANDSPQRVAPLLNIRINGSMYRLKAVVQRPNAKDTQGGHYTCCEIAKDGKSLQNYDDSRVSIFEGSEAQIAEYLKEARGLLYEKV